ncbi:hypothetical protein B0T22DRAFT_251721 [Podospora appendiculata]|uniref:Secreted protein n=1 Tax=Podospora appendiculata TaxID=314037 RepID=A0AAE0X2G5_9PEZI|nr:hypothetical protein B0T22DRAFT_251721 [Podospora appendiculata]
MMVMMLMAPWPLLVVCGRSTVASFDGLAQFTRVDVVLLLVRGSCMLQRSMQAMLPAPNPPRRCIGARAPLDPTREQTQVSHDGAPTLRTEVQNKARMPRIKISRDCKAGPADRPGYATQSGLYPIPIDLTASLGSRQGPCATYPEPQVRAGTRWFVEKMERIEATGYACRFLFLVIDNIGFA